MMSVVSICNKGLRYLGGQEIQSLEQESRGAILCRQYYPEVRDELLAGHDWGFATRHVALPEVVAEGWSGFSRAYQLPSICLRVRRLRGDEPFAVREQRLLHTNAAAAEVELTVRVNDPSLFPPLFAEALARKLAADIAVPLMNSTRLAQSMLQRYLDALERARHADACEEGVPVAGACPWLAARA